MNNALTFTVGDTVKDFPEQTLYEVPPVTIPTIDAGDANLVLVTDLVNISKSIEGDKPDIHGSIDISVGFYDSSTNKIGDNIVLEADSKQWPGSYSDEKITVTYDIPANTRGFVIHQADGTSLSYGRNNAGVNSSDLLYSLSVHVSGIFVDIGTEVDVLEQADSLTIAPQTGTEIVAAIDAELGNTTWQGGGGSGSGEANVQADWDETSSSSDAYIENKPTTITAAQTAKLAGIEASATTDQSNTEIVAAVDAALGNTTWKQGGGGANVQSDWSVTDNSSDAYIANKPIAALARIPVANPGNTKVWKTDGSGTPGWRDDAVSSSGGGEQNVQANWNETDSSSDAYIQNKPASATIVAAPFTFRIGWDQQDSHTAGVFTRGNSADGVAVGSTSGLNIPSFPSAISASPTLWLHFWFPGDPSFISITDNTGVDWLARLGNGMSLTVLGTAGTSYIASERYASSLAGRTIIVSTLGNDGLLAKHDIENFAFKDLSNRVSTAKLGSGTASGTTILYGDGAWKDSPTPITPAQTTKLAGIPAGAEVNVQADWDETNTSSDAYIQNKPASTGGGSSTFVALTDTPTALGTAGQIPAVNSAGDALEFINAATGGGGGGFATTQVFSGDINIITNNNWVSTGYVIPVDGWFMVNFGKRHSSQPGNAPWYWVNVAQLRALTPQVVNTLKVDVVNRYLLVPEAVFGHHAYLTINSSFELMVTTPSTAIDILPLTVRTVEESSGGGGGSSGASTFVALTDTPTDIEANRLVKGNTAGDALEFVPEPIPSEPIPVVARIPGVTDSSPDIVFLSHAYTVGARADATLTIGTDSTLVGYDNGATGNTPYGSVSSRSPLAFMVGLGSTTNYNLSTLGSTNEDWLNSFTHVVIGIAEYALLPSFVSNGVYERRIASYPENLNGNQTINFKRSDGTFYFNSSVTSIEHPGIYEKVDGAYARLTSKGLVHIDGVGAPTSPPTAAAQSYVDDTGRLWVSGDRITQTAVPPNISDVAFVNNFLVYVSTLSLATEGQFVAAASGGFLQRINDSQGNPAARTATWNQIWTYIASNVTNGNTSTIRDLRDKSVYLGEYASRDEAAAVRNTYTTAGVTYYYTSTTHTPHSVRTITAYTASSTINVDHYFWRGPLTILSDITGYLDDQVFRFNDGYGPPTDKPGSGGQIETNNAGEIYVGSDEFVNVSDNVPTFSTAPVDVIWTRWKGVSNIGSDLGGVGGSDGDFEFRVSPLTSFFMRQGINTFVVTWDEIQAYLRANSLLANSPTGLVPATAPYSKYLGFQHSDAGAASAIAHNNYLDTATTPFVWINRIGTDSSAWKLRLAAAGTYVSATITRTEVFSWKGPIRQSGPFITEIYTDAANTTRANHIWYDVTLTGDIRATDLLAFEFRAVGGYSRTAAWMPGYDWYELPASASTTVDVPNSNANRIWATIVAGVGTSAMGYEVVDNEPFKLSIRKRSETSLSFLCSSALSQINRFKIIRWRW